MIRVLFFASIREALECPRMELNYSTEVADLDALQAYIIARGGDKWREVLTRPNVIRAVNQAVVEGNRALSDDDEVAFFPPVTGG
jgi:molybdopterin synthase sulfur carrier subunit